MINDFENKPFPKWLWFWSAGEKSSYFLIKLFIYAKINERQWLISVTKTRVGVWACDLPPRSSVWSPGLSKDVVKEPQEKWPEVATIQDEECSAPSHLAQEHLLLSHGNSGADTLSLNPRTKHLHHRRLHRTEQILKNTPSRKVNNSKRKSANTQLPSVLQEKN